MKVIKFLRSVYDINTTYSVALSDETAFGCTTKCRAHPNLMEGLHRSLNPKILQDLKGNTVESSYVQNNSDQPNHMENMSVPNTPTQDTTRYVGID